MKQLQDWLIAFFYFDFVIHFFLVSVHWCGILIEITTKHHKVFILIVSLILKDLLVNKFLHFFDLLVASHICFYEERCTSAEVTGLEMRVKEV